MVDYWPIKVDAFIHIRDMLIRRTLYMGQHLRNAVIHRLRSQRPSFIPSLLLSLTL